MTRLETLTIWISIGMFNILVYDIHIYTYTYIHIYIYIHTYRHDDTPRDVYDVDFHSIGVSNILVRGGYGH